MAAIEVSKLWTQRGATDDLNNHRTYTREYEVITDDDDDDEQVVGNASVDGVTIPIPGDALDSDPGAICVSVKPRQSDDSPRIWYVEVEYDSDPPTANDKGADKPDHKVDLDGNNIDKGERQSNPLLEPAQWSLAFESRETPVVDGIKVKPSGALDIPSPEAWNRNTVYKRGTYVKNGGNVYHCVSSTGDQKSAPAPANGPAGNGTEIVDNDLKWDYFATFAQTQNDPNYATPVALLNSAWLPFDPGVAVEVYNLRLSVTKNMPIISLEYMLNVANGQNIFTWRGVPPRCAIIRTLTCDGGKEQNGVKYVTSKWEISLERDTWDVRVLDAGLYERVTYTDQLTLVQVTDYIAIKDADGQPIKEPVPLDGRGRRLKPDDPPVFVRFVPRQTHFIDFNNILPF